jgi:hypothetical protein
MRGVVLIVSRRSGGPLRQLPSVVQLTEVAVVRRAHQADVLRIVVATHTEGIPVVILEPVTLGTPASLRIGKATATPVATVDDAPYLSRDVSRRGSRPCLPFAGRLRLGESSSFQPAPQLPDRLPDDRGKITVRNLRAHQRLQPIEIVATLGPGRELDSVAPRRKSIESGAMSDDSTRRDWRNTSASRERSSSSEAGQLTKVPGTRSGSSVPDSLASVRWSPGRQKSDSLHSYPFRNR